MKANRLFSSVAVSILLAGLPIAGARAADPTKASSTEGTDEVSTEGDADNFFRVGETYKISTLWPYWKAYANQTSKRFDDFDALLKKAGAPAPVIADLQQYRQSITPLPWTKSWDSWSDAEKKGWTNGAMNFDVWRTWLNGKSYDKLFYFYLGRESMNDWYNIEKAISDNDASLADRTQILKDSLTSVHVLLTDGGYAHGRSKLSPETLAALKQIDDLNDTINDPLNGGTVTQETVTKLGTAGKALRDLARASRLMAK